MRSYFHTLSSLSPSQPFSNPGISSYRSLAFALAVAFSSSAIAAQAQSKSSTAPAPAAAPVLGRATVPSAAPLGEVPLGLQAPASAPATAAPATAAPATAAPATAAPAAGGPVAAEAAALTADATAVAPTGETPIAVNIDGRVIAPEPAPLLDSGAVFVPLRGVLENLGAKVEYFPADKRIEIQQNGKLYTLRAGVPGATSGADIVPLAASKVVGGRAFVPLRSLAELFGYRVAWLSAQRTVAIYTSNSIKPVAVDHRAELAIGGSMGVEIDIVGLTDDEVDTLLDAAKESGVGLVKIRFDWGTLEPVKGGAFQWTQFDNVVRAVRERGLKLVGVLGNTAQWASVSLSSEPDAWRNSPPRESESPAWTNYVTRVVGRYKVDVQSWQVWENPSAANFRSVARNYRKLARLAVDAARVSDPKAIVHAAEPGGVELDFISDLTSNGLTPLLDGVQVFPVSQWQPGVPNPAENFVLPYATLRDKLQVADGKKRDYWLGGISTPVFERNSGPGSEVSLNEAQRALVSTYSANAQADYLVRM
ncbi:hypothetical protein EON80_10715, partial [bacterium]